MIRSQNVLFSASVQGEPSAHPQGEELAQRLADELNVRGLVVSDIDNWRDCGWCIDLIHRDAPFQVVIASVHEDGWMAQLAPVNQPGLILRLFGAQVTDKSTELYELARATHNALTDIGCSNLRWKIDGYPDDLATSEPVESAD